MAKPREDIRATELTDQLIGRAITVRTSDGVTAEGWLTGFSIEAEGIYAWSGVAVNAMGHVTIQLGIRGTEVRADLGDEVTIHEEAD